MANLSGPGEVQPVNPPPKRQVPFALQAKRNLLFGHAPKEGARPGVDVLAEDRKPFASPAAIPQPDNEKENTMSDTKKKPASKLSLYPVSCAIWRNETAKGEAFYSATFERSYKDADGKYKSTDSFTASDLLLLAKLADQAHTEIVKLRENDRAAQTDESAAA
jgi:hypothetical protein